MASSSFPEVMIFVVGDPQTGKSSLIHAAAYAESWDGAIPPKVPFVMPPTRLPEDMFPDCVPVTAVDVSAPSATVFYRYRRRRHNAAIVLVYSKSSVDRLSTFWLPELQMLVGESIPVILALSRSELERDSKYDDYENDKWISTLMREFPQVEMCIEFSLGDRSQIPEVFRAAQKAVLHPRGPLLDPKTQMLRPECVRALMRIFILCDNDRDGALSDAELNDLQVSIYSQCRYISTLLCMLYVTLELEVIKWLAWVLFTYEHVQCFDEPIILSFVKGSVVHNCSEGVNEKGLTLRGFLILHELCIAKGLTEVTWTVLRKFGHIDSLRLGGDHLLPPIKRTPDQSVELTSEAVEFLRGVFSFSLFGRDCVCSFIYSLLSHVCDTSLLSPCLSLDDFLAEWALMTLLSPDLSVENLIYLGYPDDPCSAVRVTRGRCVDRKKQQSDRNVFQCFVLGPSKAGKSSLLQAFVGRPFSETYRPFILKKQLTVNIFDQPDGTHKTLILREIPENYLWSQEGWAACDVAVFVHDSSDKSSWLRAKEMLVRLASFGESTGYEVPCLIVAAKGDLEPYPTAIQDSTRASQDMGIEAPIRISTKLGDFNNVFRKIVRAAEHPHLNIPKRIVSKCQKQYHGLLSLPLMVVSVVATVNIVRLVAYSVDATKMKKPSSS